MRQSSGGREPDKHDGPAAPGAAAPGAGAPVAIALGAAGALVAGVGAWFARDALAALPGTALVPLGAAALGVGLLVAAPLALLANGGGRDADALADAAEAMAAGDLTRGLGEAPAGALRRPWLATQSLQARLRALALDLRGAGRDTAEKAQDVARGCGLGAGTAGRIASGTRAAAEQAAVVTSSLRALADDGARLAEATTRVAAHAHDGSASNIRLRVLAQENRVRLEESGTALEGLVVDTESSALEVEALAGASEEIRAFVTLVRKMARQSKLLALNAAMEAARAGEHGQGFAVVASEVRRLARSSADAADRTDELVTQLLERVASARAASGRAVAAVRGALGATEQGLASFREVERGVVESERWTSQLDRSASEVGETLAGVLARLGAVAGESERVGSMLRELAASGESHAEILGEAAEAAQALAAAASRVAAAGAGFAEGSAAQEASGGSAVRRAPTRGALVAG